MRFPQNAAGRHSRGPNARVSHRSPPLEDAGNAGCAVRTRSLVRKSRKRTRVVTTGRTVQPAFPARWCYGFLRTLPGDRAFCHRRQLNAQHCRQLDASVEASGPHDFSVRFVTARQSMPKRPSHPAPNIRDDRETPSHGARDARRSARDLPVATSNMPATFQHDGQIGRRGQNPVKCKYSCRCRA